MTRPATRKADTPVTDVDLPDDTPPSGDREETRAAEPDPNIHPAMIGHHQQRAMAAALRDHGITTDAAVYDYLSAYTGREVSSRKQLTTAEAAHIIRDLIDNPPRAGSPERLDALRAEFPVEAVGKLPRLTCKACRESGRKRCDEHQWVSRCRECGNSHSSATMHIDFVGHADVTARLLEVDPEWTWRPFTTDELNGIHPALRDGLWIMLTVCGVTRPGYGDTENGKGAKEAIGDALRNGAMRFGVALNLWAKGDREWAHTEKTGAEDMHPDAAPPRQSQSDTSPQDVPQNVQPVLGPEDWAQDDVAKGLTAELLTDLDNLAVRAGTDRAGITARWRHAQDNITVAQLTDLAPMTLAPLVDSIRDYLDKQEAAKV